MAEFYYKNDGIQDILVAETLQKILNHWYLQM